MVERVNHSRSGLRNDRKVVSDILQGDLSGHSDDVNAANCGVCHDVLDDLA